MLRNLGQIGAGVIDLALEPPQQAVKQADTTPEHVTLQEQPAGKQSGSETEGASEQVDALHDADAAIREGGPGRAAGNMGTLCLWFSILLLLLLLLLLQPQLALPSPLSKLAGPAPAPCRHRQAGSAADAVAV